jgi:hypothetical protein
LQVPIFFNYASCKSHGKKIEFFTVRVEGTGSLKGFVVVVAAAAVVVQDVDVDDDHNLFVVLNTKLSFTNTVKRAVIIIIELLGHQKLRIWNYPSCTSYLTCYI